MLKQREESLLDCLGKLQSESQESVADIVKRHVPAKEEWVPEKPIATVFEGEVATMLSTLVYLFLILAIEAHVGLLLYFIMR